MSELPSGKDITELYKALKSLRGEHDQTMRCGTIKAIFGTKKVNGQTPTQRFLEFMILLVQADLQSAINDGGEA